jgi:hypothetical protein
VTAAFAVAGARSQSAGATNLTPALPSVTGRVGGILLCVASQKSNNALTTGQPGWTALAQDNSGASFTARAFIAPVGSGAPNIAAAGSAAMSAQIFYIEDPDNLMDATAIGNTSVATGIVNPHTSASINSTRWGSLIVGYDVAAANTTLVAPSGWVLNNDEGSPTDAGRTSIFTKYLAASGSPSGAVSVTGAAAAWVQRQIELRIILPATGLQINGEEISAMMTSGDGVSVSGEEFTAALQSGVGVSCSGMEIVYMLAPGPTRRVRSFVSVLE